MKKYFFGQTRRGERTDFYRFKPGKTQLRMKNYLKSQHVGICLQIKLNFIIFT